VKSAARDPDSGVQLVGRVALFPIDSPPSIPLNVSLEEFFATGSPISIDATTLRTTTEAPSAFAHPGIASDAWLRHLVLRENGINIPVNELVAADDAGLDDASASFYALFARKRDAQAALRECDMPGLTGKISKAGAEWSLVLYGDPTESVDAIDERLERIVAAHNGIFDGHELAIG
jgi:hypothetical protein